jgi:hypothetical protein
MNSPEKSEPQPLPATIPPTSHPGSQDQQQSRISPVKKPQHPDIKSQLKNQP